MDGKGIPLVAGSRTWKGHMAMLMRRAGGQGDACIAWIGRQ